MWSKLQDFYATTFGQAMVSAVVLWAALPPLNLWPLAWIAPLWWVGLARRKQLAGQPAPRALGSTTSRVLTAVPRWLLDPAHPYRGLWLAGFLFWLAAVHWVRLAHLSAYFGWVALAFYLAFYLPAFVGLTRVAVHKLRLPVILAAPMVWTGLELARGHLLGGFTMASLGHTQYRWIELIQLSDLAGAYGVSFLVMLVAACLARMTTCDQRPRTGWPLLPAIALLGATLLYGYVRTSHEHGPPVARIALIQGSVDTEIKFDPEMRELVFEEYLLLSQEAIEKSKPAKVDLIVWPETMFRDTLVTFDEPPPMFDDFDGTEEEFRQAFRAYAARTPRLMEQVAVALDAPMILGVDRLHYEPQGGERRLNSAVFVAKHGKLLGHYEKTHLVMFGEYVPFVRHFPSLQRLTPVSISISPGTRATVFELDGGLRIAPNICYETVIPHVIRRQVEETEPDVLVNLTNDGWFWGSSELEMHLACGVFRAVECRKPLLIAANTGISAWIDGDGRILARGPRRHKDPQLNSDATLTTLQRQRRRRWCEQCGPWPKGTATILADVRPDGRESWYLEYGDWPAGICLAGCVVLGLTAAWARVRPKAAGDQT